MKRLAFTATTAVIFSAALGGCVYLAWQAVKAGWYFAGGSLAVGAVVLWILAGVAIEEASASIRRRGYTRRVGATGGGGSVFGFTVPSLKTKREPDNVFYYAIREDKTKGEVAAIDIYKLLLGHHVGDKVLQQEIYAPQIGRGYLDDICTVCIQAGIVRVMGNGGKRLLYPPHIAIERLYDYYYGG